MKIFLLLFLLLISSSLKAQDDKGPETASYCSLLEPGESFSFGKNTFQFIRVISDSRCPEDVTCVWAGEAKILVAFYGNGDFLKDKILTLGSSTIPLDFTVQAINYSISNMVLFPYPTTKLTDPEYRLKIKIIEDVNQ